MHLHLDDFCHALAVADNHFRQTQSKFVQAGRKRVRVDSPTFPIGKDDSTITG